MYRIRPVRPGGLRVVFLKAVNEVRPVIAGLRGLDASAIVNSNHYFGGLLRRQGVDQQELTRLLLAASGDQGVLQLANRLQITLADTAQLVSDIKESDGQMVSARWQPSLLDFRRRTVPRR